MMRMRIDSGMEIIFSSVFLFLYSGDPLSIEIPLYPQITLLIVNRRKYDNADRIRTARINGIICITHSL